jgi:putative membrane protein
MIRAEWTGVAEQAGRDLGALLPWIGPLVAVSVLAWLIGRAVATQGRYRLARALPDADRAAVRAAVGEAERGTIGEILPVLVERADPHPVAEWRAGLVFLLAGSMLLFAWLPWGSPVPLLLGQLAFGALGFLLVRALPGFRRMFIREERATAVAEEQAFQEFWANGLHRTERGSGVLLFVSLLERRVVVLADEGIDAVTADDEWERVSTLVLEGVRAGSLREGLVAGIRVAGEALARHFPAPEGNRNEIPDRVILREE